MMNTITINERTVQSAGIKSRGAALMIALLTALVVMLAATLLISLSKRMADSHLRRITDAQVILAEASAADGMAHLIENQGISQASLGESFELAGVTTSFQLVETETAGIRRGFYAVQDPVNSVIVPTPGALISAVSTDAGLVTFTFYSNDSYQPIFDFTLETQLKPVAGILLPGDQNEAAVFVLKGAGETQLCAISSEGIIASSFVENVYLPESSFLSASISRDGVPFLITTNGSNLGILYDVSTGATENLYSAPGTCPMFLPDGSVYGSMTSSGPSLSIARVRDAFTGDFNSDGVQDAAFATSYSLSSYSGATGQLQYHAPGGSLVCYGDVQGRSGLIGMWRLPDGQEEWFRLGIDGFTEFIPENVHRSGWENRFAALGNTYVGFIDGSSMVVSSNGYQELIFQGLSFMSNFDDGENDFYQITQDGIEVCFNPVYGEGLRLAFQAENSYRGANYLGNVHIFSVYESPSGRQVFHNLEGVER